MASSSSPSQSTLMGLPGTVREMILEELLMPCVRRYDDNASTRCHDEVIFDSVGYEFATSSCHHQRRHSQILRVCRALNQEGSFVLYGRTVFKLASLRVPFLFLRGTLSDLDSFKFVIGPRNFFHIRHIDVSLDRAASLFAIIALKWLLLERYSLKSLFNQLHRTAKLFHRDSGIFAAPQLRSIKISHSDTICTKNFPSLHLHVYSNLERSVDHLATLAELPPGGRRLEGTSLGSAQDKAITRILSTGLRNPMNFTILCLVQLMNPKYETSTTNLLPARVFTLPSPVQGTPSLTLITRDRLPRTLPASWMEEDVAGLEREVRLDKAELRAVRGGEEEIDNERMREILGVLDQKGGWTFMGAKIW